jgi:tRNA-Thr(GGU) m(6)t(6)A37 methyltransferase TsaA
LTAQSDNGLNREICFRAIGIVRNNFDEPTDPQKIREADSQIILDETLVEGLAGLEVGQSILVIFNFDRSPETFELLQHPRGDRSRPKRGVFALRSPHRPNALAVSAVELLAIEGNVLHVRGLDALDNTPVLDIKPAIKQPG